MSNIWMSLSSFDLSLFNVIFSLLGSLPSIFLTDENLQLIDFFSLNRKTNFLLPGHFCRTRENTNFTWRLLNLMRSLFWEDGETCSIEWKREMRKKVNAMKQSWINAFVYLRVVLLVWDGREIGLSRNETSFTVGFVRWGRKSLCLRERWSVALSMQRVDCCQVKRVALVRLCQTCRKILSKSSMSFPSENKENLFDWWSLFFFGEKKSAVRQTKWLVFRAFKSTSRQVDNGSTMVGSRPRAKM